MKSIRITKDCFVSGQPVKAGDTVEVDDRAAGDLIVAGRGTEIKADEKPPKKAKAAG